MRVLYVSQYFPPEMGAPSARVHELAREWVRCGHQVTVLTAFAHHPTGIKARGDRFRIMRREKVDGIDVVRTYVWATANKGTVKRMVSYASFMMSAALLGPLLIRRRPDVVIATSPQLLCGVAGYVLSRVLRRPFILEIRDLWPESILAVEAMRENALIRFLKRVAGFLYTRSDQIVTVGDGYRRLIAERYGTPMDKMAVIPNGIDTGTFIPGPRDNGIRRELGWGDRFVCMYVGTHGMAHGLRSVLEAAQMLSDDPIFHFVLVGEGAEKDDLKRLAAAWELTNVEFVDQQPKSRIAEFYSACDLGLVTLRDTPLFQEVLPSKIFEYLGMERPVLIAVGGDARALVERAGAGRYVPPGDPAAMASAIRDLASDPERLRTMGLRGRRCVLSEFNRKRLAESYLQILAPYASVNSSDEVIAGSM